MASGVGVGPAIQEAVLLASTDGVPVTDTGGRLLPLRHTGQALHVIPYQWNTTTLAFEPISTASAGGKTVTYVTVDQAGAGTTQLAAASPGNKHKVIGCVLTLSAAGSLKFLDSAEDLTGAMDISGTGGFVLPAGPFPFLETKAVNRSLSITTTGGAARGVVAILTEP